MMKRILSLLLGLFFLFPTIVCAEDTTQARVDSGLVGVWIENDGYGTLTLRVDGTSEMIYYDNTVTECTWDVTPDGAKFLDGQWLNSPMELLEENTLSVANGWMVFTREGFLPATDPALLLNAMPVGEEGEPFLGQWSLSTLILEGEALDPSIFGMVMNLAFNADGTIVIDDGMEPYTTTWFESYGSAVVEGDILSIDEKDQLILNTGDGSMVFTRIVEEIDPPAAEDPLPTEEEEPVSTEEPAYEEDPFFFEEPAYEEDPFFFEEPAYEEDPIPVGIPVGEEGAPFLGQWTLVSIEFDGMSMDPGLLGMTMTLTLTEDGLAAVTDDLDTQTTTWAVVDGAAIVEGSPLTLTEDGRLVMQDEGAAMIFAQGVTDEPGETSDADELMALLALLAMMEEESALPEEHQGFVGEWYLCYVATGGLTGDLRSMGVTGTLTLYEDYTGWLTGIAEEDATWYEDEEGVIRFGESGMPMYLLGDETSPAGIFLQYGSAMGGYMIFSQDEEAVWDPAAYELQPVIPEAPVVSAPAVSGGEFRLGVKYVCTSYSVGGVANDASILGAEYAVVFREDGLADFTMAGYTMTDLGCTVGEDGTRTIHYVGNALPCVPTENGIDMDYFGIIYHMEPVE